MNGGTAYFYNVPSETGRNSTMRQLFPFSGGSTYILYRESSSLTFEEDTEEPDPVLISRTSTLYVHARRPVSLSPVFRSKSYLIRHPNLELEVTRLENRTRTCAMDKRLPIPYRSPRCPHVIGQRRDGDKQTPSHKAGQQAAMLDCFHHHSPSYPRSMMLTHRLAQWRVGRE